MVTSANSQAHAEAAEVPTQVRAALEQITLCTTNYMYQR